MRVKHKNGCLEVGNKTLVMGILNVTPDSFFDGGKYNQLEKALNRARKMIEEGADIIDVGGESTRPGSSHVTEDEEIRRVIPVIRELSKETNIPISIDTYKANVADKAVSAGAQIINDISGLQSDSKMVQVAAANNTSVIIMHIKGLPHKFPENPVYVDLVPEIISFLERRIEYANNAGIKFESMIIDPGIGFGKRAEHNLEILKRLDEFKSLNLPIMIGTSRKSFINKIFKQPDGTNIVDNNLRFVGTLVTLVIALAKGVNIVRVHDVKETVQAVKMYRAIALEN